MSNVSPALRISTTGATAFDQLLDLIGIEANERVSICSSKHAGHFDHMTPIDRGDAVRVALSATYATRDVWYSVNPIELPPGYYGRGAAAHVTRCVALYADIDVKAGGVADAEVANVVAMDIAAVLGRQPVGVVASGHGGHPYWALDRDDPAWRLDSHAKRAAAIAVYRRFQRMCAGVATGRGGSVDNVGDLCRILRVPGTYNRKDPANPIPVFLVPHPYGEGRPLTFAAVTKALDANEVPEFPEDCEILGAVISEPAEWEFGELTDAYVTKMIDGWRTDIPRGGVSRHNWMVSQATRLADARRLGRITEEDHAEAVGVLRDAFHRLLTHHGEPRPPMPHDEFKQALAWGVAKVACKTDEQTAEDLGADFGPATFNFDDGEHEHRRDDAAEAARIRALFGAEPLPLRVAGLPAFPLRALPPVLASMAEAVAVELDIDPAMTAPMAIAAVSGALNGHVDVQVRPGWRENGVTYVLVVTGTGERKSAAFGAMFSGPLLAVERELVEEYRQPNLVQGEPDLPIMVPEGEHEVIGPAPRLLVSDVTTEQLAVLMGENGERMILGDAEGDVFDMLAGRYTQMPSLNLYLYSYTGEAVRIDRVSRAAVLLDHPALTICIATQVEVCHAAMVNPRFVSKGLVSRLEFAYPATRQERSVARRAQEAQDRSAVGAAVPPEVSSEYWRLIRRLTLDSREQGTQTVGLTLEARDRVARYSEEIDRRRWDDDGDLHGALESWAAKCAGRVARRALHMHMADLMAESDTYGARVLIDHTMIKRAIEIEEWFIANARAAFGVSATGEVAVEDAADVLGWLNRQHAKAPLRPVLQRELSRCGPRVARRQSTREPVIDLLVDLNQIIRVKVGKADALLVYPAAG